jgi:hypothetical protein
METLPVRASGSSVQEPRTPTEAEDRGRPGGDAGVRASRRRYAYALALVWVCACSVLYAVEVLKLLGGVG